MVTDLKQLIRDNPNKRIHELITEESWCQGNWCVINNGILCKRCLTSWIFAMYHDAAFAAILEKVRDRIQCDNIVPYNDAKERTFTDIINLCKELDI